MISASKKSQQKKKNLKEAAEVVKNALVFTGIGLKGNMVSCRTVANHFYTLVCWMKIAVHGEFCATCCLRRLDGQLLPITPYLYKWDEGQLLELWTVDVHFFCPWQVEGLLMSISTSELYDNFCPWWVAWGLLSMASWRTVAVRVFNCMTNENSRP